MILQHVKVKYTLSSLTETLDFGALINEPCYEKTVVLHICENKDADQLRSNCATDQRL